MCWNPTVSINTFVFSIFVLIIVIYNNTYTEYKIPELNFFVYLFFISFVLMQLVEFFLWRNLNNKYYNYIFSVFGLFLITVQPFFSLLIIKNLYIRNVLSSVYIIPAFSFFLYQLAFNKNINTSLTKNGHLHWNWANINNKVLFNVLLGVWLFFLGFSFLYEKIYYLLIFGIISYIISLYTFSKDGSYESIWCWSINILFLYYAFLILIYLPFRECIQQN